MQIHCKKYCRHEGSGEEEEEEDEVQVAASLIRISPIKQVNLMMIIRMNGFQDHSIGMSRRQTERQSFRHGDLCHFSFRYYSISYLVLRNMA